MSENSNSFNNLLLEILLWYLLPFLFLALYVPGYSHSLSSAINHLHIASLLIFAAIVCRVLIFELFSNEKLAKVATSTLYASFIFGMLIYYGLVIIGLKSWGRVISEELITSYANQAPQLCEALGLSFHLILIALLGIYVITWLLCYLFINSFNWSIPRVKISLSVIIASLLTLLIVLAFNSFQYIESTDISNKEPITLTLWGSKPKTAIHSAMQGAIISKELNEAEQKEISSYKVDFQANRKNLVLIVVDALRPNNMGVYGYSRPTTPYLSALKKSSQLIEYEQVHSSCSESACGLISLASSRYVHELPEQPFTIQKLLKLYGYKIHMILGGDHTNFYNLKENYGPVDTYFDGSMASGFYVNDDAFVVHHTQQLPSWDGKPMMLQYHLMSAHPLGTHKKEFKIYNPSHGYTSLLNDKPNEKYINFYDNGVLQTDSVIHQLMDLLKSKHYLDNTLVVITADHGEALGEHKKYSHANGVNEEVLKIPLLFISINGTEKNLVTRKTISQVDIAPSILYDFKMPIPKNWSGSPIQIAKDPTFTFFQLYPNEGLYDHTDSKNIWKYWFNIHSGEEFAYNLSTDSNETNNLIQNIPLNLKQRWRNKLATNKL